MNLELSIFIYYVILTSSALFGVFNFKYLEIPYKVLVVLIVITCIKELVFKYVYMESFEGNYLSHLLLMITLIMNPFIYLPQWGGGNKKIKDYMIFISVFFIILFVLSFIYVQGLEMMPANGLVALCLQMVIFSLLSFKIIINSPAVNSIYKNPLFWLSIANLFLYTILYLNFAFFHFYKGVGAMGSWLPLLSAFSNYLLYIGYGIAIYVHKKTFNVQRR
jgi:hypothetical protein